MTIPITGAAGFIGLHLTGQLLAIGHHVMGLDNFDNQYDPACKRVNVCLFIEHPRFQFVAGDVRDQSLLARLLEQHDCDTVVHLAGRTGIGQRTGFVSRRERERHSVPAGGYADDGR